MRRDLVRRIEALERLAEESQVPTEQPRYVPIAWTIVTQDGGLPPRSCNFRSAAYRNQKTAEGVLRSLRDRAFGLGAEADEYRVVPLYLEVTP